MKVPEFVRRFLPESAFAKNVSVLVGGTALGQVIAVLASPLLTRLYAADDFGVLAVYSSIGVGKNARQMNYIAYCESAFVYLREAKTFYY